jgi:two-component system, LytTR family, response regulator
MMRIIIADDEPPARAKLRRWLADQPDAEIVGEFADGLSALSAILTAVPDVVFLDVQMPGLSGLEVAAQLDADAAPFLVFITAYDAHAVAAFDLQAVDYILKPYDEERFRRALDRIRERFGGADRRSAAVRVARQQTGVSDRLLVPDGESLRLIDTSTIQSLEADDNYVHVRTIDRSYTVRRTLQDLLAQLGENRFVRIHKSAAVNIGEIDALAPLFKGDYEIRLRSGKCLRLSRRYTAALFARTGR